MKVRISEECISCGECVEICPEVFEMGTDYAEVKLEDIPSEYEDSVKQAAEECPVSAIVIE